ncbi:MAG TPA: nitrite/sulfite reductase [Hyphomicrobiales bacterium]|jgi:sulfite reductase (NADPH) hemoprotein beta-component
MYHYDQFDHQFVRERVAQFRSQVERRLTGALNEDEFRPLRLMNGLYLQLHAYMLRVAIPYGTLSSRKLRRLADIAEKYDKGYGHFTTRQNIQYNWPKLRDVPDILDELAEVEMHAIQTSGNCIRNVTADPYAGVAADEIADPRPTSELIRQWSSNHPEFSFLPRKFKIAVTGAEADRAVMKFHDIGLRIVENQAGERGYQIWAGGGLGRTPMIGIKVRDFVREVDILRFIEAIMRVYNAEGRRDNKWKARIKILVHEKGGEEFRKAVEEEFAQTPHDPAAPVGKELRRIEAFFKPPAYETLPDESAALTAAMRNNPAFARWVRVNTRQHKAPGYALAIISLKPTGGAPGDATAEQMRAMADAADSFSLGELRVTAEQNIVLPHVKKSDLFSLWLDLEEDGLGSANAEMISDVVSCPGLDYCSLATARSIPIAQEITERFADAALQEKIGPIRIKISGCINACGHHHVGDIGILGLEKTGAEAYQITLGGDPTDSAAIGERSGPGFPAEGVTDAIERLIHFYLGKRQDGETFKQTYHRLGHDVMKEALYAAH